MPQIAHSIQGTNLADLLERVLDKGIVIAGDIRIKLVEIELLTIQIRLLIASVDKAREMGIDWWVHSPFLSSAAGNGAASPQREAEIADLKQRLERLEAR
ncbi:MAG: gas vesicle protein [Acidobacteriota bacterium]